MINIKEKSIGHSSSSSNDITITVKCQVFEGVYAYKCYTVGVKKRIFFTLTANNNTDLKDVYVDQQRVKTDGL